MKRPLAVVGLMFLVTLAVVLHCHSFVVTAAVVGGAVLAAAAAVLYRIVTRRVRSHLTVVVGSVSVLCAVLVLFLFQNFRVRPIVNAYADQTVRVQGYVGDVIRVKDSFVTYTLHAESIDGAPADVKISYTAYSGYDLEPFDRLSVTLTPQETSYSYTMSRGIYLYAYEEDGADVVLTGEKHFTPYAWAVWLRQQFRHTLNRMLSSDAAAVACAVLLGDKASLPDDIYQAFLQTGTSYLIVVSGMHLAVITLLFRRAFRRLEPYNAWLPFAVISFLTVGFMAVTGFTPSVTRAGVMLMISYVAKLFFRDNDGFNSLGVAALVLTLPNPYAVGDLGLLLSFTASFGILLWAEPMANFCMKKLSLTLELRKPQTRRAKTACLLKRAARVAVMVFCTSLAASLWVLPVAALLFERVSLLTVVVSLVAYPLTCAVLLLSFALVLLFYVPVLSWILTGLIDVFSAWLVAVEQWFAAIPFSSVPANRAYILIWLAVSVLLVLTGYLFQRGRRFVVAAVMVSALTLSIGGSLTYLTEDETATLTVWRFGSGYTAMVRKGSNVSLLSCGGRRKEIGTVTDVLSHTELLDNVIAAGNFKKNAAYLPQLLEEKRIGNLLLYEGSQKEERLSADSAAWFSDNTRFTVALNSDVTVEVVCADGKVFQYVSSDSVSVLLIPQKADVTRLPEELRQADVAVTESRVNLSGIAARRLITLADNGSGEVLGDGEVFEIALK